MTKTTLSTKSVVLLVVAVAAIPLFNVAGQIAGKHLYHFVVAM